MAGECSLLIIYPYSYVLINSMYRQAACKHTWLVRDELHTQQSNWVFLSLYVMNCCWKFRQIVFPFWHTNDLIVLWQWTFSASAAVKCKHIFECFFPPLCATHSYRWVTVFFYIQGVHSVGATGSVLDSKAKMHHRHICYSDEMECAKKVLLEESLVSKNIDLGLI